MATKQARFYTDVVNIDTAGTAEAIGTSKLHIQWIRFRGLPGNKGEVYYGNKAGDVASTTGMPLLPGEYSKVLDFRPGSITADMIFVDTANDDDDIAFESLVERAAG